MKLGQNIKYVVGIDEAGRGPLAGPVSVGACMVAKNFAVQNFGKIFGILKDSKKLSEKRREEIYEQVKKLQEEGKLRYSVGLISNEIIDKKGIVFAINSALEGVLKKVAPDPKEVKIYLDGSLSAPKEYEQETIIKGDEKIPVISLASIMAKVVRDRYMKKIAKDYPEYGFEIHMGYGTKKHIEIIKKFGLSKIHRTTFCKNFI